MPSKDTKKEWREYIASELGRLEPRLRALGYTLESEQPHIGGERHLMMSRGRRKVVLFARHHSDNCKVVIKASSEPGGAEEIRIERKRREVLNTIGFAYQALLAPKEIFWEEQDTMTISITEFIEQDLPFLERPTEEQFSLVLKAFKAQEAAHATTASHIRLVTEVFGERRADDYQRIAQDIVSKLHGTELYPNIGSPTDTLLDDTLTLIETNKGILEQYGSFLTNWDFTPQNFRIRNGTIYLLDHFSFHFGNKYEGWARFINFMELYNPTLANALIRYVHDNRTPAETLSLKTMRAYRLLELIRFYAVQVSNATDSLHDLAKARIIFWSAVLRSVLDDTKVPAETIEVYKKVRDSLRSEDERKRQVGLH